MKKYKFRYIHLLLVPVIAVVIYFAWYTIPMIYNPIRRPNSMIRNHILRHTPIGIDMEEVIEIIENNERWGTPSVRRNSGFIHPSPWDYGMRSRELIIGEMHIQSHPEWHNSPLFLERHIRIFWGFDESGKLIEVHVYSSLGPRLV